MSKTKLSRKLATNVRTKGADTIIRLYDTDIVRFNAHTITLCNGGWITVLTARRMEEVARAYDLDFYVTVRGEKRVRNSNNILNKCANPTGATMRAHVRGMVLEFDSNNRVTFDRTSPLPDSPIETMAQTDTEH